MNKKIKQYIRNFLLFLSFILFLIIFYILLLFSLFDYRYEYTINNNLIGYYKNEEEYNDYYNQIIENNIENGFTTIKSFSTNPENKKVLIRKDYLKTIDNLQLIENNISKQYKVYEIFVNEENKMIVKTYEEAEQIVEKLKEEVKQNTIIEIKENIIDNIDQVQSSEEQQMITNTIIEENKPVVTSRSNTSRVESMSLIWPISSKNITSNYGMRNGKLHTGVDIATPLNSEVRAALGGTVTYSGWNGNYGYYIKIKYDDNVTTAYAHNNKLLVKVGEKVKQGDLIAYSGSTGNSTGPHLHFEIIMNNKFINPLKYY